MLLWEKLCDNEFSLDIVQRFKGNVQVGRFTRLEIQVLLCRNGFELRACVCSPV